MRGHKPFFHVIEFWLIRWSAGGEPEGSAGSATSHGSCMRGSRP
jgi:hypothetical protein